MIYNWLPYVLAAVAAGIGIVVFVRARRRRQMALDEDLLAIRRTRLKALHSNASRGLPNPASTQEQTSRASDMEAGTDPTGAAPHQALGADPAGSLFLRQIRYFEEQFRAQLPPGESRIVDSVLSESFSCDRSFARWWEEARVQWSDRDFVAHVDALHPTLAQS